MNSSTERDSFAVNSVPGMDGLPGLRGCAK